MLQEIYKIYSLLEDLNYFVINDDNRVKSTKEVQLEAERNRDYIN